MGDVITNILAVDEKDYMEGKALYEAIFAYGDAGLIQEYRASLGSAPLENLNNIKEGDWVGFIQGVGAGLNKLQSAAYQRKDIFKILKAEIAALIKNGDLIPFGYQLPRNLKDTPVKLPIDLFVSGEINWEDSELIYKDLEFAGIRLINNENQLSEPVVELSNNKEIKLKTFSDLDTESHINEKEAAEYLGISPRTLQGYRTKGGGPEFKKIGNKAIRYKIADLIKWCDGNKKGNTSEY